MKRSAALWALVGALLVMAAPALGQEEPGGEGDQAPVAQEEPAGGGELTPAVPVEPEPETPALADWTYRYIIPTGLALAAVVILMTSIRYFTNVVRKRYRIVRE